MTVKEIKKHDLTMYISGGVFALTIAIIFFVFYRLSIQPREGVVIRKDYTPAYTTTDYNYVYKNGESIRVPMQKYHAESYTITIKGINAKGKEDTGIYNVTPEEYSRIEIGDYYIKESSR